MKSARDAFADAISLAERNLKRNRPSSSETPQQRGHAVTKLSEERAKKRKSEAREIVQAVRLLGLDAETMAKVQDAAKAHAKASESWIFVMLSPAQNAEVVNWLLSNSKRPQNAVMVWARLLERLRIDTGEIMATREELADRVGLAPRTLSEIMTELASINAIRREKVGRNVRYFLNPHIATHVPNAAKRAAERDKAGPLLRLMEK